MLHSAITREIPIWTDAQLDELMVENDRVVGVRTVRAGSRVLIRARRGVLVAAGGFAHNREMRERYGGDQPNRARWSIANAGDTGEALRAAMELGAKTDLMDEAWWLPSPRTGRFGQSTLDQARQRPRTIYVDAAGQRFVNESNSYMEVGKEMYARDKTSRAVPCWLIFDDRYRKRYAHQRSRPGRFPRTLLESGMLKQAWTLDDLARVCDIDPAGLSATVERFNKNAEQGSDPDYGRGESAYNRALGDPNRSVHPCLGPINEPPYYAVQVVPGDIGTCGGLVTDEHARVVDQDNQPIEGLYATGNGTATVMGRHYLGPGASIANTMVFGYVAARHATQEDHAASS
jgi:3-oxosteroid 1-dehydrogenase